MGSTVKTLAALAISLFIVSCGIMEPFGVSPDEQASIALKLSMNNTTQTPNRVIVNVAAQNYNQSKEALYNHPEGITFSGIPLGDANIHVEALWEEVKLLDGHAFINLHSGTNTIHVPLNNVLIAYHISPSQENQFDKGIDAKTPFWDMLSGKNCATLDNPKANALVTAALGENALYFLVSLNDEKFISENEITGPIGEWINDAFIMYFCIQSAQQPDFFNSPCFRIQCQMGNIDPNLGKLQLKSFNTSPQVDIMNTIVDFQEIDAKIIEVAANTRILEMRIFKDKIGLGGIGKPGDRFAVALRYNNVEEQNQTDGDKIDWKNRMGNPLEKSEPWGNLEFQ